MVSVSYFQRYGPRAKTQLLQRADVATANLAVFNDSTLRHDSQSRDTAPGCVLAQYQATTVHVLPADLAAVPQPRVGYTGFLDSVHLDLPLLLTLARKRPDWHLVLVGAEDEDFRCSPLHALPNVHFLGNKTPDQLPAYVQHFDVCINPQVANTEMQGDDPLKIDEYLAMSRPVVATRTRTMELFEDYTYLAATKYEWLAQVAQVLVAPDAARAARAMAFAQSHTWAASVEKLYAAVRSASFGLSVSGFIAPVARLAVA